MDTGKKKTLIAIILTAVVGMALNAAEPFHISVFTTDSAQNPPKDNKIYKLMEQELGVVLDWDIAVGQVDQKIGVMIASGDYPDLLVQGNTKFIDAKAVIPLEDLITEHGPNLKKHYASVWDKITESDGHIYCLPNWGVIDGRYRSTYFGDSALWIQKAVLKEFNYPKITTMDEYFDLIAKYKAKYPTIDGKPTIGFSILTYDYRVFCLINPPNFLAGNPNDGNGVVDKKTFEYKTFLDMDISKRWFKKLGEMNAAGLVDKECFVDNYDQYLAKLASGRVLGVHDQRWQFADSQTSLLNQGKYNRTFAPLPIVFDKGIRPWYRQRPLPNLLRGYGISVDAKDPVRIIKFLDAQLSERWQKIFQWGIEGEDYLMGKDGAPYRTPEMRKQQEDAAWQLRNKGALWFSNAPKMEGSFSDGNPTSMGEIKSEYQATARKEDLELFEAYGVASYAELMDKDPPENPIYYPAWQISPPDGSKAGLAWKKAESTFRRYLPRIIMAEPKDFEKLWAQYVDALGKVNMKAYEDYIHEGILDRVRKWGSKNNTRKFY